MTDTLSDQKVFPRWWKITQGRICVTYDSNSVHAKVMKGFGVKPIGNDTYIFTWNKTKYPTVEKLFRSVNSVLQKDYNLDATQFFTRQESKLIHRTLDDLKNMPISDCTTVVEYKTPPSLGKKKINIVESLKKVGIESMYDMLFYLPRKYIDRTNPLTNFDNVLSGENIVVMGTVLSAYTANSGIARTSLKIDVGNNSTIDAVFFRQPWIQRVFSVGSDVIITGKFNEWNGNPQIMSGTIELSNGNSKPVVPIYKQHQTKGLTSAFFERLAGEVISELGIIEIPSYMKNTMSGSLTKYFKNVHSPLKMDYLEISSKKLALYELTLLQSVIQHQNEMNPQSQTIVCEENLDNPIVKDLLDNHLPFTLTDEQKDAVDLVHKEMREGNADNILLSADVGAGKTIIAQLGALRAVEAGNQAVLAAPTEVLAKQLFDKTVSLVSYRSDVEVAFLSGTIKAKERKEIEKRVSNGEIDIVVGTHLTLTNYKMYQSLAFVCIDEQHKFGAQQRSAISESLSAKEGLSPVVMQQTATPIPRSMAQALFGGITMIRIKQKPSGRKPIKTKWVNAKPDHVLAKKDNAIWRSMRKELDAGNQAFIIAPFVTDSAFMEDVSSVESLFKEIKKVFPERKNKIAMIHGKMKPEEINITMEKVHNKEYDIIIASTVVEVGVDVPDATFITIMSADRLGIASLHQLRGRVGRNSKQSYCVLVAYEPSVTGVSRMRALEKSNDGFELAEEDLKTRGSGLIFGSKQSGDSELHFSKDVLSPELIDTSYKLARSVIFSTDKNNALKDAETYFGNNVNSAEFNSILI